MAFKFNEASSSDCPPDKKQTPARAGTIVLERVLTVNHAISSGLLLFSQVAPGVTMFGFNRHPSNKRCCLNISDMHAENTLSETAAQVSIL